MRIPVKRVKVVVSLGKIRLKLDYRCLVVPKAHI